MDITPAQCRAARALLIMTQGRLAELSRVSKRTIVHFEAGQRRPIPASLQAIRQALEAAGVEFTPDGGVRPRAGLGQGEAAP
jgi:transcriptional regulator with XRE-family HTH domain